MARPKKNNLVETVKNIVTSKKQESKKTVKENKSIDNEIEENAVSEIQEDNKETIVEKKEIVEEVVQETIVEKKESVEENAENQKQFIEEIVYTNDNQPKDTSNFKPVQVMKNSELDYFKKRSEVIARLKEDPKYKFLSMISLIKIAEIYMKKNY